MDGSFGIKLYFQDEEGLPLVLGAIGFSTGKSLEEYHLNLKEYQNLVDPIIVQLQGQHSYSNGKNFRRAQEILSSFRFEDVLLDSLLQWVNSVGLPRIYLLPAERNVYYSGYRIPDLKKRYDGSARKWGFKKDPNGLLRLGQQDCSLDKDPDASLQLTF